MNWEVNSLCVHKLYKSRKTEWLENFIVMVYFYCPSPSSFIFTLLFLIPFFVQYINPYLYLFLLDKTSYLTRSKIGLKKGILIYFVNCNKDKLMWLLGKKFNNVHRASLKFLTNVRLFFLLPIQIYTLICCL